MRTLTSNFTGKPKRVTVNGREFLLAPVTMIVPGVLPGSKGPLYYPPEEVARNADDWNGVLIVAPMHPVSESGRPLAATRNESAGYVKQKFGVGRVYNAHITRRGNLAGVGRFDVKKMERVAPDLLERVEAGEPVELSTGLFTRDIEAPAGSVDPKGRPYDYIATNYVPDHLAVLAYSPGACSLRDGCGVGVYNSHEPTTRSQETGMTKLTPQQREEHVKFITTNCSCWSGKGDAKVLNAFPDEKLVELREHVEEEAENKVIVNAAREGFTLNGVEFVVNAEGHFIAKKGAKEVDVTENGDECADMMKPKDKKKGKKGPPIPALNEEDDDDDEEDEEEEEVTPATNGRLTRQQIGAAVANYLKSLTPQQHLNLLPPEMRAAVTNGIKADKKQRTQFIAALTANISDPEAKKKHAARYAKMETDDLEAEVQLRGLSRNESSGNTGGGNPNDLDGFFFGGAGGSERTAREVTVNADDVLPLPGDPGYLVTVNGDESDDE